MDEGADATSKLQNEMDEGEEIPSYAKQAVIEAIQDLEADEAAEYDLHPKHAI